MKDEKQNLKKLWLGLSQALKRLVRLYELRVHNDKVSEAGSVVIECAVTFPVFSSIIFAGIVAVNVAHQAIILQNATDHASRYAALGYILPGDSDGIDSVRARIQTLAGFELDDGAFSVCKVAPGNTHCDGASNTRGGENEWILIQARKTIPVFAGIGNITISASTTAPNEPGFTLHVPGTGGADPLSPRPLEEQGA